MNNYRGVFVLWTGELMNQFLKNHQLNKAEIGVTDESISDWISGFQVTFSSTIRNMALVLLSNELLIINNLEVSVLFNI